MKVACRFPLLPSPQLACLMGLLHLSWLVLSYWYFGLSYFFFVIFILSLISGYCNWLHYLKLTRFEDDLCWSGEHWQYMQQSHQGEIRYLEICKDSWLSSFACLLHFKEDQREFWWLFTRQSLGRRSYSQLCYLVKQTIGQQRFSKN